jgi:phosphoglycolate phosphatase
MASRIGEIALFDGIRDVLRAAAANGIRLAIVSSNSEANVRRVLGPDAALFGRYECGAALFGKPRKLRRAAQAIGVPAGRVLCIGDEVRDIEAARAAGMHAGAVGWGYARPDVLRSRGPQRMFDKVADLAQLLQG